MSQAVTHNFNRCCFILFPPEEKVNLQSLFTQKELEICKELSWVLGVFFNIVCDMVQGIFMERQSDIYSDISNLISDISKYLETSKIN